MKAKPVYPQKRSHPLTETGETPKCSNGQKRPKGNDFKALIQNSSDGVLAQL